MTDSDLDPYKLLCEARSMLGSNSLDPDAVGTLINRIYESLEEYNKNINPTWRWVHLHEAERIAINLAWKIKNDR